MAFGLHRDLPPTLELIDRVAYYAAKWSISNFALDLILILFDIEPQNIKISADADAVVLFFTAACLARNKFCILNETANRES